MPKSDSYKVGLNKMQHKKSQNWDPRKIITTSYQAMGNPKTLQLGTTNPAATLGELYTQKGEYDGDY